jgi:hypothetical protein
MTSGAPLICLIAPGPVASTPRLVKEADALSEAGYRVHVVYARTFPAAGRLEQTLLEAAPWGHTRVEGLRGGGVAVRRALRRLARLLMARGWVSSLALAARASGSHSLFLGAVAARVPAALYIGHCLPALPAAALAARRRGAALGFDLEDFHDAETEDALRDPVERSLRRLLQSRLLPACVHLTASSPLISRRYEQDYGVRPLTLLNVFPRSQGPASPVDPGPISEGRPATLYWFSQTVGPGRGLEAVIAAMGLMRTPAALHLRGLPAPGYAEHLQGLASRAKRRFPIRILEAAPPADMARLAATADLGLSTELRLPPNRDLCLTNKIFVYLLAGIPQLLSRTSAQAELAAELGPAALLADLGRPDEVAAQLDSLFGAPERLAAARARASALAGRRYCWDVEKGAFLESVARVAPLP